ncbi:unnamed protein product [Protopolystoma xenopodis]|uniref:Uncharacterized protein n=1 Tax=Protopolystoma xenopodis TaxID=117903 RepID=A0A448WVK0_9PLAT|nr:unnamed protein product [Protopolystoma xenopodis]
MRQLWQMRSVKEEERSANKLRNIKDSARTCIRKDPKKRNTMHERETKSTERLAAFGENMRKRKIREAIEILTERNIMNRRLEEGRISENFAFA